MADICPPTSPPTTTTTVSTFERACRHAKTLRNLSSDQQLELYALYKQSQHGPCDIAKPAFWDFTGKAKWQSWKALGDVSASEAEERYVELVKQLDTSWNELAGDDEVIMSSIIDGEIPNDVIFFGFLDCQHTFPFYET